MEVLPGTITTEFRVANYVEAGVWAFVAVVSLLPQLKVAWTRRERLIAFANFLAFGLSDVVETQTGAWWRPWWLLAWKAVCVGVAVGLIVVAVRNRNKEPTRE